MELFLILLLFAAGLVLIVFGGDMFVDSAIWIAEKAKIPKMLIGATIVSIGTTLPEITVSLIAAGGGDVGLAVSNATGSMLCNLTLILGIGLSAVVMKVSRRKYAEKFLFSLVNIGLLLIFVIDLKISLIESVILLVLFAAFMTVNVIQAVRENRDGRAESALASPPAGGVALTLPPETAGVKERPAWLMVVLFIAGAAGIGFGAKLMVDNATRLAVDFLQIPTVVVGATIVAFGTGLPEFVTAVNSIRKKSLEMSVGNVLGANVINGTFLIGMSGALQGTAGMPVAEDGLAVFVCFFALLAGLLLLIPTIMAKGKTYRWQGIAMIGVYVLYILYVVLEAVL